MRFALFSPFLLQVVAAVSCLTVAAPSYAQTYTIQTVAGLDRLRDGNPANTVALREPYDVAGDAAGNLYIADRADHRVRRIAPNGVISTVAGRGTPGFSGDGGPAINAQLDNPTCVAVDQAGNLYICDYDNQRVRRVSPDGVIRTVAGNGGFEYNGDNVPAITAAIDPLDAAVDADGTLYIADTLNNRIRRVSATGTITTLAGSDELDYTGDGGPAALATLALPTGVAVSASTVYIADYFNSVVRRVTPDGLISTVVGNGNFRYSGDGGNALAAGLDANAVALGSDGSLYISDAFNSRVRKVTPAGIITTVAGSGNTGFSGDGGAATAANLNSPDGIFVAANGTLFVADGSVRRVRRVAPDGVISTVAGTALQEGTPALQTFLNEPAGIVRDAAGNLLVSDTSNSRVIRIAANGTVTTFAGTGLAGLSSGGQAASAQVASPLGLAYDAAGNLYIADGNAHVVYRVSATGALTRFAGTGRAGYSGDGALASAAQLRGPTAVAVDGSGNVYIVDAGNFRVRRVSSTGIITNVAGNGVGTASGDNGPATVAGMAPEDIAIDGSGNVLVAEPTNGRVRIIRPDGVIATFAGTGTLGTSGDGGPATAARLLVPSGIALDRDGSVLLAAFDRIRRIAPNGVITTIAGGNGVGFSGDGGSAASALLTAYRLYADSRDGSIFFSDPLADRIRVLRPVAASRLTAVSGGAQSGPAGQRLASPLVVQVVTAEGVPLAGVIVTFRVAAGTATVTPTTATTGTDGRASATVTLGSTAGAVSVVASAPGSADVTFALTITGAAPAVGPRISAGGVVGAGASVPAVQTVAPGMIVSIYGASFAPTGTFRVASGSDLVNGALPRQLEGVCVRFGTQQAPLFALLPGQINAQVPSLGAGPVEVRVVTGCGTATETVSSPEVVTVAPVAPEFFYFRPSASGRNAIAAADAVSGALIGDPAALGSGFRFARPGDILTLYATGLGAVSPTIAPGELPPGAANLVGGLPRVTLNGTALAAADVLYAGVAPLFAGLYQLNIRIPETAPDGELTVGLEVGGRTAPATGYISVRR